MRIHHFLPLVAILVSACSAYPNEPTAADLRSIRLESDTAKTVTVTGGMVFYNGSPGNPRTKGIRFPPGVYALEGEDDNYWDVRAPAPLEFRVFRAGIEGRNSEGCESPRDDGLGGLTPKTLSPQSLAKLKDKFIEAIVRCVWLKATAARMLAGLQQKGRPVLNSVPLLIDDFSRQSLAYLRWGEWAASQLRHS